LWRCGDGLFFEVPVLATLHPLLENVLIPFAATFRRIVEQTVLTSELPFPGWKSPESAWGEIWTVWRMF
jgi:hypothetical protein